MIAHGERVDKAPGSAARSALAPTVTGDAPRDMTTSPASSAGVVSPEHVVLRAAVAAYLGRYRGASRLHTESDLRIFLTWCVGQDLSPLSAARGDIERYVR